MLFSDGSAVLAFPAHGTKLYRIGPGDRDLRQRIPLVQAAMATLNRLASGRVLLRVGTGHAE